VPAIVLLIGLIATVTGSYVAVKAKGVYWSRGQVRFIAPTSEEFPNGLQISPSSTVMTAGAVRRIVDDRDPPRTVSQDVTIVGEGIKQGWSVTLPNTGGQWASNFTNPYLDVQAVGPTPEYVTATMNRLINEISAALASLQARSSVDSVNLISTQVSPLGGPPLYFQRGSRPRAGLAALALGIGLTSCAVAWARRLTRRRRDTVVADSTAPELVAV
jgi:hypothetical protein